VFLPQHQSFINNLVCSALQETEKSTSTLTMMTMMNGSGYDSLKSTITADWQPLCDIIPEFWPKAKVFLILSIYLEFLSLERTSVIDPIFVRRFLCRDRFRSSTVRNLSLGIETRRDLQGGGQRSAIFGLLLVDWERIRRHIKSFQTSGFASAITLFPWKPTSVWDYPRGHAHYIAFRLFHLHRFATTAKKLIATRYDVANRLMRLK